MSAPHSRTSAMLLLLLSICSLRSMSALQGISPDFAREALRESHKAAAAEEVNEVEKEGFTMDDFEHLDESEMGALSLVQTDASVERTSVVSGKASMAGAVQSDGSIEMESQKSETSNDGMMHFSVDGQGSLHTEDGFALMQTEVHKQEQESLAPPSMAQGDTSLKIRKTPVESNGHVASNSNDLEEPKGLSLVQTGASVERTSVVSGKASLAGAVRSDGSIEMEPQKSETSNDGMMHFSVDGQGSLHTEDGFALMQTEVHKQEHESLAPPSTAQGDTSLKIRKTPVESSSHVASHSNDLEEPKGLSLMQTGAQLEGKPASSQRESVAALPDGTFERNPRETIVPSDGSMHFSLDEHGNFHQEDGLSLLQTSTKIELLDRPLIVEADHPSWSMEAQEDQEDAASLSLMQTSAHIERATIAGVVQSDGTMEINPQKAEVAKDGAMHLSVDGNGAFHMEQ